MDLGNRQQTAGDAIASEQVFWAASPEDDWGPEPWHLLDHFLLSSRPVFSLSGRAWTPPVDLTETPDRILLRMEIAGIQHKDLSVTFERGILTISGRRYERAPDEQETVHLMEIRHGRFERAFRLSDNVVEDEIRAHYHDGFLNIEIPKGRTKGNAVKVAVRED